MSQALNELACFGWSRRGWARPWRGWQDLRPKQTLAHGLEIGAGRQSSLTPLMLGFADQVDCSYFDPAQLGDVQTLHRRTVDAQALDRISYACHDVRALTGRWDLIVMKSVLGGVFRERDSQLADLQALIGTLVSQHLKPGGWLVTLDNGRTALEPLWARFGARRNGWRFLRHAEFPKADMFCSFGLLGSFSAATRLGRLGHLVDDGLYALDCALTPLVRHHAVLLHAYQRPAA